MELKAPDTLLPAADAVPTQGGASDAAAVQYVEKPA